MFSLATRPVMEATAACQLPQPSGLKIQAISVADLGKDGGVDLGPQSSIRNVPSTQPK